MMRTSVVKWNRFQITSRAQNGFTLVELILVLAVMAILGAVVVPNFAKIGTKAKETALKSTAHTIQVALEAYFLQNGTYPSGDLSIDSLSNILKEDQSLTTNIINPFTGHDATGADPSGRISYHAETTGSHYTIKVYGEGNAGVIATLGN